MKRLIVGADSQGSWQMRGVQLGQVLKARVTRTPTAADWAWADVVILVKRAGLVYQREASALGVPVIWDALDFWAQPAGNTRTEAELVREVRTVRQRLRAACLIGATQAMATAIGGVYLPHHCRLGLAPTPPKAQAAIVGYDGQRKYLGRWLPALDRACERLGLRFVVQPPDLREVDVLVSFRDGKWDGWACRQWKSGVKYVNAIVAGRPVITQDAAAFRELAPVGEVVDWEDGLVDALRIVTSRTVRERAYEQGRERSAGFRVEALAARYAEILRVAERRVA